MTVSQMRNKLKRAPKYKLAPAWIEKVDQMHEKQVIAVYFRLRDAGEL